MIYGDENSPYEESVECPICEEINTVHMTLGQYSRYTDYLNGAKGEDGKYKYPFIQDALPDLDPAPREILFKGICDKHFGGE